jgi:hypothetical protein
MAGSSNESRINLIRIAHVYYTHKEIDKAHEFLLDFGFQEVKRVDKDIYYRGTSSESFVYCARQGKEDGFEMHDFDTQVLGHDWLRSKGYANCWGVGRHIMGSQIFDYWYVSLYHFTQRKIPTHI